VIEQGIWRVITKEELKVLYKDLDLVGDINIADASKWYYNHIRKRNGKRPTPQILSRRLHCTEQWKTKENQSVNS
jgi:hypothetical protein